MINYNNEVEPTNLKKLILRLKFNEIFKGIQLSGYAYVV